MRQIVRLGDIHQQKIQFRVNRCKLYWIGRTHYQEGINQLLNHRRNPQIYYDRALTSYHNALQTLTREKFPTLRLETLKDTPTPDRP